MTGSIRRLRPASGRASESEERREQAAVTDQSPTSVNEEIETPVAADDEVAAALANWPTNTANPRRTQI
ncbi:hypothetical protein GCM10010439_12860 [Actinocorallia aurantiaca]|uniref:Uncharacterized protein n=1 Tax=Actinocorallia aurantiaca TaxID=46204 RepID=A0ABP6GI74_9ACTN